jgi:hypothetical protein
MAPAMRGRVAGNGRALRQRRGWREAMHHVNGEATGVLDAREKATARGGIALHGHILSGGESRQVVGTGGMKAHAQVGGVAAIDRHQIRRGAMAAQIDGVLAVPRPVQAEVFIERGHPLQIWRAVADEGDVGD